MGASFKIDSFKFAQDMFHLFGAVSKTGIGGTVFPTPGLISREQRDREERQILGFPPVDGPNKKNDTAAADKKKAATSSRVVKSRSGGIQDSSGPLLGRGGGSLVSRPTLAKKTLLGN